LPEDCVWELLVLALGTRKRQRRRTLYNRAKATDEEEIREGKKRSRGKKKGRWRPGSDG